MCADPTNPAQIDIQNMLLKGTLAECRSLPTSLPRLTLMLYELSSPGDGESTEQQMEKLRIESPRYLAMAYNGLSDVNMAQMVIALRTLGYWRARASKTR